MCSRGAVVDSDDEDEPEAIPQPATQSSSSATTGAAAATFDDETAEDDDKAAEDPETQPAPAKRPKPAIAAFFQPRKKPAAKPATKSSGSVASFFTRVSKPAAATKDDSSSAAAVASPAKDAPAAAAAQPDAGTEHIARAASIRAGQYDPVLSVADQWRKGEAVPYSALCAVLRRVEGISSRLEMQTVSSVASRFAPLLAVRSGPAAPPRAFSRLSSAPRLSSARQATVGAA